MIIGTYVMKTLEFKPAFMDSLPTNNKMEPGVLYISEKYGCTKHFCACGCGVLTICPIGGPDRWTLTKHSDSVISLYASIYNRQMCGAHYFITENKVVWC